MKNRMQMGIGAIAVVLISACTTADKGATPADTATGQTTTVAPASASGPVLSAPLDSVAPAPTPAPTTTTRPKATTSTTRPKATTSAPTEPLRDSAFKPRATVDDKGNITPIKRDTLK